MSWQKYFCEQIDVKLSLPSDRKVISVRKCKKKKKNPLPRSGKNIIVAKGCKTFVAKRS